MIRKSIIKCSERLEIINPKYIYLDYSIPASAADNLRSLITKHSEVIPETLVKSTII
jgi:hypothetical protein